VIQLDKWLRRCAKPPIERINKCADEIIESLEALEGADQQLDQRP
jgi:hypothetical protein